MQIGVHVSSTDIRTFRVFALSTAGIRADNRGTSCAICPDGRSPVRKSREAADYTRIERLEERQPNIERRQVSARGSRGNRLKSRARDRPRRINLDFEIAIERFLQREKRREPTRARASRFGCAIGCSLTRGMRNEENRVGGRMWRCNMWGGR